MKTKQKAIRRIPSVNYCPPPLDLPPDVEHMDCQPESLKRERLVSDVMGLHACPENSRKKICTEKSRLPEQNRFDTVQMPSSQNNAPDDPTSSCTMPFQFHDGISDLHNSEARHPNAQTYVTTPKSKGYRCHMQGIFGSALSEVNGRSQRRISHNYAPANNQQTNTHSSRIRPVCSIDETAQRHGKRPRFTQATYQEQHTGNNNIRTNTNQRRRARQGPPSTYISIGSCNQVCKHCNAFFWYGERIKSGNRRCPEYHHCCNNGKVVLPVTKDSPAYIREIFQDRHFMENIRAYNQMFAMTSLGAEVDNSINTGRGPYVFKVSGKIYHWIGSMCPEQNKEPKFLQLYIYDTTNEVNNRLQHFNNTGGRLRRDIVENLIQVLDRHNELVKFFRTARDKMGSANIPDFKVKLFGVAGSRQYDLPEGDSIGAIVFEGGPDVSTNYDVIIEPRGGEPQRIDNLNPHYMSLHFPLLR